MINGKLKLLKYVVLGREQIIKNLDGDDQRKVITEMYVRKPNTQINGMFVEYEKFMYNEIVGNRGRDVELQEGSSFITVDGSAQDFINLNFKSNSIFDHNVKVIKTYPNRKFLKRVRETSYHEEYDVTLDSSGNVLKIPVAKAAPVPKAIADFSTIPAGGKYLYNRWTTGGVEVISTNDIGHWLKTNDVNSSMLPEMSSSLDAIAINGWSSVSANTIAPDDGDFDALEKVLQCNPDWVEDVNFKKFVE